MFNKYFIDPYAVFTSQHLLPFASYLAGFNLTASLISLLKVAFDF